MVNVMVFDFNVRKAAQVVSYLANKNSNSRINILKVIKLVYLADRESILQTGFPIIDDDRVSMPHGPVNSMTLRFVKGELEDGSWSALIKRYGRYEILANTSESTVDCDELSESEIGCLDKVWETFGHMDRYALRDWTHDPRNVPEWTNPNGSSLPIPLRSIFEHLNCENADIQSQLVDDYRQINRLLANL